MLPKVSKEGLLVESFSGAAAQQPQKKSPARDRSCPGLNKAVTKRDPRRSRGLSPNSRQSRRRPMVDASSHQQDRDDSMDGSTQNANVSFVGIDVSKSKFDVAIAPEGVDLTCPYDRQGMDMLLERLAKQPCLIVLEA